MLKTNINREDIMANKFKNVPTDQDTYIDFEQEASLGKYNVLYQKWHFDGITAESIIFCNGDITDLHDNDIKQEVKESPIVNKDSKMTIKRSKSGYTFVNFNFIAH